MEVLVQILHGPSKGFCVMAQIKAQIAPNVIALSKKKKKILLVIDDNINNN